MLQPADRTENLGYPTQKPESLLALLLSATTNPGDLVMDCFCGSGTTLAVAEKLRRRWIGIDSSKLSIYTVQKRLLNLRANVGNDGPSHSAAPFTLFNAGLYDFSRLRELPWDAWRFFALQLFQCRDAPHAIGGIRLDGYLKGASVIVFNHMMRKDARIDEDTIASLHESLGTRIGSRLFIIAPALTFDFQQDYIQLGAVRYYALRIPYSIIHELHRRQFTALTQPSDEQAINDTVEAVGFDFVRTPEIKFETSRKQSGARSCASLRLTVFKSDAAVREPWQTKANMETLSMVMLDLDYDEERKLFELDRVIYASELQAQSWEVLVPLSELGRGMMAVFIDIYGNEARVVLARSCFSLSMKRNTSVVAARVQRRKMGRRVLHGQKKR